MKRLCVFYYRADEWLGKRVEWIVCRECQRKLQRGMTLRSQIANAPRGWAMTAEQQKQVEAIIAAHPDNLSLAEDGTVIMREGETYIGWVHPETLIDVYYGVKGIDIGLPGCPAEMSGV